MLPAKRPSYDNRYVEELVQSTLESVDCADLDNQTQFPDKTTEIWLAWYVSGEQWTKVFSALNYGADFAYPSEAIDIVSKFVESVCSGMSICDAITDCIETNPSVQNAINNYILTSGVVDPNNGSPTIPMIDIRFPFSERDLPIKSDPTGCDNDVLWAGIREVVARLDDNGRDFLEDLNVIADKAERLNEMISLVPVIGSVLQSITTQFVEIIPDILNLYNGYSSESVMDDIACDLFQLVCNDCKYPTYNQIMDYYSAGAASGYQDWVNLAVQTAVQSGASLAGFSGLVVYRSIITLQLYFMYLKSKFNFANGPETLGVWASLGEDFPSDNWIVLCDGCDPVVQQGEWDFTTSDCSFVKQALANRGVYDGVNGWKTEQNGGATGCWIYHPLPATCVPTKVEVTYANNGNVWTEGALLRDNPESGAGQFGLYQVNTGDNPNTQCQNSIGVHRDYILVYINKPSLVSDIGYIQSIRMEYDGDSPSDFTSTTGISFVC